MCDPLWIASCLHWLEVLDPAGNCLDCPGRLAAVELPYKVRSPAAFSSIGVFIAYLLANDVKPPLASLVASTAFWAGSPAAALPPLDDLELELKGEAQGWVNATCTYYGMGWLTEEQGTNALRRLMLVINGAYLGKAAGQETTKAALERDPGCKSIWPDIPE